MNAQLLALAIGLTLSVGAFADDKAKDVKKDAVVRELDARMFRGDYPVFVKQRLSLVVPITAETLPKLFPNKEVQARLKKEVDFTKEQILLIQWWGGADDQLTYTVEKGEKGPVVYFRYQAGTMKPKENDPASKKVPEPDFKHGILRRNRETLLSRAFAVLKDVPCYTQDLPCGPDPFSIPKHATGKVPSK